MDLVTFGEAMVRLTPPAFQRLEQARSFDVCIGGAELNVAVAAARLGVASRWVSRLPENAFGRMIANAAREHGVDAHVEWTADARAGLYFAELGAAPRASSVLYDRGESAISKVLSPQQAPPIAPSASHPWEGVAILAGGFAFLLAGLSLRKGRNLDLPAA